MPTPTLRSAVSRLATTGVALLLAACASVAPRSDQNTTALTIRFDNEGRERVQVYLVGEQREWLLGRVEPGAIGHLPLPPASFAGKSPFVRLAVLTGNHTSLQAARSRAASTTVAQPLAALVKHQWHFVQGQVTPRLRGPQS